MIERCLGHESEERRFMAAALGADPHFSLRWSAVARKALA